MFSSSLLSSELERAANPRTKIAGQRAANILISSARLERFLRSSGEIVIAAPENNPDVVDKVAPSASSGFLNQSVKDSSAIQKCRVDWQHSLSINKLTSHCNLRIAGFRNAHQPCRSYSHGSDKIYDGCHGPRWFLSRLAAALRRFNWWNRMCCSGVMAGKRMVGKVRAATSEPW